MYLFDILETMSDICQARATLRLHDTKPVLTMANLDEVAGVVYSELSMNLASRPVGVFFIYLEIL